jgi:hypothetical protein
MDLGSTQDVNVIVTNSLGAIVKSMNLKGVSNGVYDIDMKDAAKGTYEIAIKTNEKVVTRRIAITQ